MSRASRPRSPVSAPILATVLSALIAGGCAGDGCTCAGPIPGGFPPAERAENAVQLRISDSGLAALSQDPAALIDSLLGPGGLVFEVPPACGPTDNPKICCDGNGNPVTPCGPVEVDIQLRAGDLPRLELAAVTGQRRLDATVRARVRSLADLPIIYDTGLFDVTCDAAIDTRASGAEDILVDVPVRLVEDPAAGTTRVEVDQVDISQFDNGDLSLSGGFDCTIADLLVFAFKNRLVSAVEGVVRESVSEQTCKACLSGDVAECGAFAVGCVDQVCMADADQCLQELGVSARIPAAGLLGGFSPGTSGAVDLYDVLGGYATTDAGGLSFGLLGGALPADSARRCGPVAAPPEMASIPVSPFFQGNARPDTGEPFDVALGVHRQHIDSLLWSAYESGALCLNVGSSAVELLNTDTVSLLMPSVLDLAHGRTSQMVLGIRPQSPPDVTLGRGTFIDDGAGNQVVDEPLLDISLTDLDIDFYAMVDDQFIRVMTLTADVRLPMNLDADADGNLVPVMGDLAGAFQNLRVKNSEALAETPDFLTQRFPAILDLILPMVADALGPVALPEVAGLRLRVPSGGVTSVDGNSFLAVFAGLEYAQPAARTARVATTARISAMGIPDADAFHRMAPAETPYIELALGGQDSRGGDGPLEWSVRVDGGVYSPYSTSPRARLSRPALWLQGRHRVEVRAREIDRPWTADPTPVVLEPVIDVTPPHLSVIQPERRRALGAAWVMATDNVSRGALLGRFRVGGGDWRELPLPGVIRAADLGASPQDPAQGAVEVEVEVRDEAGNRAAAVFSTNISSAPPERAVAAAGGCDAVGRAQGYGLALWLVLVAGGIAARTRRRRGARVAVGRALALGLAGALIAACGGGDRCDVSGGEVAYGPTGRYSDLAALGDRVVVSAYEQSLGDLVLLDIDPSAGTAPGAALAVRRRQVVDGAPAGVEPTYAACSYRGGVLGEGPDVGAHTSVVLADQDGKPRARIAYQDIDQGALRFAYEAGDGDFRVHVVDPGDGGVAGVYTSLALNASGTPGIAYMVAGIPGPGGSRIAQLRYAQARVAEPADAADWTIQIADQTTVSCAGLCAAGEACVLDAGAERCAVPTTDCAADCGAGACVDGACLTAIADPATYDLPQGTGLFANLAYLPDGRAAIVYYDRTSTDLVLRVGQGGNWTAYPLDASADGDTGMWASMAVAPDGVVHVGYQDAISDRLLYTTWRDGQSGAVEIVDSGVRVGDRPHPVGASAALVVDPSGQVSVAYQDGLSHDLLIATREVSSWTWNDLASGQNLYGFFVNTTSFKDSFLVSSYAYDRTQNTLGELLLSPAP